MDDVAFFVMHSAREMYSYELDFVPIWEPTAAPAKSPSDSASELKAPGFAEFPIPMSHTE